MLNRFHNQYHMAKWLLLRLRGGTAAAASAWHDFPVAFLLAAEPDLDFFNSSRDLSNRYPGCFEQRQSWKPNEIHLDDGRTLVLEST